MTGGPMEYLSAPVAAVATILVEVPDPVAVADAFAAAGLAGDRRGSTVCTCLHRAADGGDPREVVVEVDTTDGVVHVYSRDTPDAYDLAPVAGSVLEAIDGTESQSLFTYATSFDHPLVDFETLVEYLDGEDATFHPGTDGRVDATGSDREVRGDDGDADAHASDRDARLVDADARPPSPDSGDRAYLAVDVEGDRFELYADGYLLPVDDAGGSALEEFLAVSNDRLRASFPPPPGALSAPELPAGWAGPLADRHPDVLGDSNRVSDLVGGNPPSSGADGDTPRLAEAVLDVAATLTFAVDACSPETRALYYDRYADADDSPLRFPVTDRDGDRVDRDRSLDGAVWSDQLDRAVAETRRTIRSLGDVVDSYDGLDLRPGQVWRHHGRDDHRIETVELAGRETVGGVSLPVWTGEVRAVENCDHDEGGDEPAGDVVGETVVVDGSLLRDRVEDARPGRE